MKTCRAFATLILAVVPFLAARAEFQAGAVALDVTPKQFPVLVNGGFLSRSADTVTDRLHARALALSDGKTEVALVVVDSCMMPKDLLDKAKAMAAERTGIPVERMLVSATHTHTAPKGGEGTPGKEACEKLKHEKLEEAIVKAIQSLQPARRTRFQADRRARSRRQGSHRLKTHHPHEKRICHHSASYPRRST